MISVLGSAFLSSKSYTFFSSKKCRIFLVIQRNGHLELLDRNPQHFFELQFVKVLWYLILRLHTVKNRKIRSRPETSQLFYYLSEQELFFQKLALIEYRYTTNWLFQTVSAPTGIVMMKFCFPLEPKPQRYGNLL